MYGLFLGRFGPMSWVKKSTGTKNDLETHSLPDFPRNCYHCGFAHALRLGGRIGSLAGRHH